MGNKESCGYGVVNNTDFNLTVCLSMGATHHCENDIAPGEVYYKWPGAVLYTIYVYPTELGKRMTPGQIAKEVGIATVIGLVGGMVLVGITYVVLNSAALTGAATEGAFAGVTSSGSASAECAAKAVAAAEKLKKNASLVLGDDTVDNISEGTHTAFNDAIASGFDIITNDDINSCHSALNSKELDNHAVDDIMQRFMKLGWQVTRTSIEAMYRKESAKEVIMQSAFDVIECSKMFGQVERCYGGGNGTWLVVSGLPFVSKEKDNEIYLIPRDIQFTPLSSFSEAKQEFLDKGYRFTDRSYQRYYRERDPSRPTK